MRRLLLNRKYTVPQAWGGRPAPGWAPPITRGIRATTVHNGAETLKAKEPASANVNRRPRYISSRLATLGLRLLADDVGKDGLNFLQRQRSLEKMLVILAGKMGAQHDFKTAAHLLVTA